MVKVLNFNKILSVVLLICCMTFCTTQNVFASSSTKNINGVDVTVTTDKDEYDFGEKILLNITTKNNTSRSVSITEVISNIDIPDITVENISFPDSLAAGEEKIMETTAMINADFERWKTINVNRENIRVGVRAVRGIVENDSEFLADVLPVGTQEYNEKWEQLDDKNKVENVAFFNLGIRKPNGELYTEMDGPVTIYIQIPYDWDEPDLEAVYVSAGVDEQFEENFVTIDGIRYLSFRTTHFSPYSMIDFLNDEEALQNQNSNSQANDRQTSDTPYSDNQTTDAKATGKKASNLKTGDSSQWVELTLILITELSLLLYVLYGKKLKKQLLVVILCFSFIGIWNINNLVFAEKVSVTYSDNIYNTVTIAGKKATISTTIKLAFTMEISVVGGEIVYNGDPIVINFNNVPYGLKGKIQIVNNNNNEDIKTILFDSSDLIDGVYKLENDFDDKSEYTITVYDQNDNELCRINF